MSTHAPQHQQRRDDRGRAAVEDRTVKDTAAPSLQLAARPAAATHNALSEMLHQSPAVQTQLRLGQSLADSPRVASQQQSAAVLKGRQLAEPLRSTAGQEQAEVPAQMQGESINDAELEEEAGVSGPEVAQRQGEDAPAQARAAHSSEPVQAIMDVDAFKNATPRVGLKRRNRVKTIDHALAAYINSALGQRLVTINALIGVINTYVGHADALPARVAAANQLLIEAQDEQGILAALGVANEGLLYDLLQRAGGMGNRAPLIQLINSITPAHAALLPSLITAAGGGPALATLDQLVNTIQPANAALLTTLIPAVGGAANLAALDNLITAITPVKASHLTQLIPLAGGAAGLPDLLNLINAAGAANAQLLDPMLRNIGCPANAAVGIPRLTVVINRHAGQGNLAFDLTSVANGVAADFNRLALEVPTFLQVGAPGVVPPGVLAAVNAYNHAVNFGVFIGPPPRTIRNVNFDHFLTRHTSRYFNFGEIKPSNTQWPTGWGAGADNAIELRVVAVLNQLAATLDWLVPNVPKPNFAVPGFAGEQVQVAAKGAPPNQVDVGMFFPLNNPGANIYDHDDATMRAINKVL